MPRKVRARHILVREREQCELLRRDIERGALSFEQAARERSLCPSKSRGGDLGVFGPGQMVPAFDKVCWSAPIGEVQGPVATQFGYHLILVTERTEPDKEK